MKIWKQEKKFKANYENGKNQKYFHLPISITY